MPEETPVVPEETPAEEAVTAEEAPVEEVVEETPPTPPRPAFDPDVEIPKLLDDGTSSFTVSIMALKDHLYGEEGEPESDAQFDEDIAEIAFAYDLDYEIEDDSVEFKKQKASPPAPTPVEEEDPGV